MLVRRPLSIVVFRFARQDSGVGTFRTTLEPIFAFFIAFLPPVSRWRKPTTMFWPGCLIDLSDYQIHHTVSVFPSLSVLTVFQVNVTVPLINGTHFSQMQAFRLRYHQTFKLLAALGYEPRTSTSFP